MEKIKCEQVAQIESKGFNDMTGRVYSVDGLSPAMRTFCGGNQEAKIMVENKIEPSLVGGFGEMKSNNGTQYYQQDRVYDSEAIAMSHCASIPNGSYNYLVYDGFNQMDMTQYRVRKLTEKECGKLMGVLPVDCEKIAKNQSRSSQYHLYGDSIVTTVLMAWFGEMLGIDWKSKVDEVVNELTGG